MLPRHGEPWRCHTHVDALNHVGYKGQLYNGKPVSTLTSRGSDWGSITAYATGIVGRGVLLDAARHRGVEWLEPGEAVTREELEAIEKAQGVRLGEGDILVFRTGHHARRLALGAWNNEYPPAGEGKAGLHVDTVPWMHERRIAAFLPDGDGETVPSNVEGMPYPIHPLQLTAMGMLHLRQPAARGTGRRLRGGRALRVHGRRPAAAPARRHRHAVESDRHLLTNGPRAWPQAPSTTPADDPAGRAKGAPTRTRLAASRSLPGAARGLETATSLELGRQDVAVAVCGRRRGELDRTVAAIERAGQWRRDGGSG